VLAKIRLSDVDGGKIDFGETLTTMEHLIGKGLDINAVDCVGNTPFNHAVAWDYYWNNVEINLKAILKSGGVANIRNHRGRTALHLASTLGSFDHCGIGNDCPSRLDFLLSPDLGIDLHARDNEGIMAIHLAASSSAINTQRLYLAHADLKAQTLDGRTPLHFAAQAAQSNIVGLLCQLYQEQSWAIDQRDSNGRTPLHEAAQAGNSECVYYLLKYGADPNAKDRKGKTPLHAVAEHQSNSKERDMQRECENLVGMSSVPRHERELAPYLVPELRRLDGQSEKNVIFGHEEEACMVQDALRLLLEAGADLAAFDKSGHTAYQAAVMAGCEAAIELLSPRMQKILSADEPAHTNRLAEEWYALRTKYAGRVVQSIDMNTGNSYRLLETAISFKNEALLGEVLQAGADPTVVGPNGLTPLHCVAYWGLTAMMKALSSCVEDLNALSPPVLHIAASRGSSNIQMVDLLIKLGVDIDASFQEIDWDLFTGHQPPSYGAVHIFAAGNKWWHTSALRSLCDAGADLELRDSDGGTALQCALGGFRNGYEATGFWRDQTLEILLTKGANVNALSPDNQSTPLTAALEANRGVELIQKLLDRGADISLGAVPALFVAIESEDLEATKVIFAAGADINAMYRPLETETFYRGPTVETPLVSAAVSRRQMGIGSERAKRRSSIMAFLLENGANPTMELEDGKTTVFHEVAYHSRILTPIIDFGVDLEIKDREGRTPLLRACSPIDINFRSIQGEYAALELIGAGADIHTTDNTGSTALHLAATSRLVETVSLLISNGASVSARDQAGCTPLYNVLILAGWDRTQLDLIQKFLSAGASPILTGPSGETALHVLAPGLMQLSPATAPSYYDGDVKYFEEYAQLYQRFIDLGCDCNARDSFGNTPLFPYLAAVKRSSDMFPYHPPAQTDIKAMLDRHDVFAVNEHGDTLLHVIARREAEDRPADNGGDSESVSLFRELMNRGLNPKRENKDGLSPLDVAAACRNDDVLELFKSEE